MKKLLIIFGLNNLILGLLIAWVQSEQFDFTLQHILLCSLIALLMVTAIGLLLKKQFAWSSNLIISAATTVIGIHATFALHESGTFDVPMHLVSAYGIRMLGFYICIGVAFFSVIRTLRRDFIQLLQITPVQKRHTVVGGTLISVLLGWALTYS
ncbi:hypothetical protein [Chryseolinea soli]|uniref:Uncharacterized protein n=1 Tax=Chryseolinea soli TaxID=2321403 RepID=A0A385T0A0_9BACT|nr:hypothetical protein [Chryseolinea soli]AYB34488.1 hypothetical protein D4L85_29640 [Chryseolinea soli]